MPHHSSREFVDSPAFLAFLDALTCDGLISQSRAVRFWNPRNRAGRQRIVTELRAVARRSNLPAEDENHIQVSWPIEPSSSEAAYDYDDPNWIDVFNEHGLERPKLRRDSLFLTSFDALIPDGILGEEPILRCRADEIDHAWLANALLARIPNEGLIRRTRVFFCAAYIRDNEYFPRFGPRRWDGWQGVPYPESDAERNANFSKNVLQKYCSDLTEKSDVRLAREALIEILSSHLFLTSDNAFLFTSEIHARSPGAEKWYTQHGNAIGNQHSIAGSPANATYQDTNGDQVLVVFPGCLDEAQIRNQFPPKRGQIIEFW